MFAEAVNTSDGVAHRGEALRRRRWQQLVCWANICSGHDTLVLMMDREIKPDTPDSAVSSVDCSKNNIVISLAFREAVT